MRWTYSPFLDDHWPSQLYFLQACKTTFFEQSLYIHPYNLFRSPHLHSHQFSSITAMSVCIPPHMPHHDYFPNNYVLLCPSFNQVPDLDQYRIHVTRVFQIPRFKNEIWFWNTFAEPVANTQRTQRFHTRVRRRGKRSLLEDLPHELIDAVFTTLLEDATDCLEALDSTLALGLSSAHLWPIVLDCLHRDYARATSTA
jgi:hypothetical protein